MYTHTRICDCDTTSIYLCISKTIKCHIAFRLCFHFLTFFPFLFIIISYFSLRCFSLIDVMHCTRRKQHVECVHVVSSALATHPNIHTNNFKSMFMCGKSSIFIILFSLHSDTYTKDGKHDTKKFSSSVISCCCCNCFILSLIVDSHFLALCEWR